MHLLAQKMQIASDARSYRLFCVRMGNTRFGENRRNARQNVCISVHWYSDPRHPCSLASLRFRLAFLPMQANTCLAGCCPHLRFPKTHFRPNGMVQRFMRNKGKRRDLRAKRNLRPARALIDENNFFVDSERKKMTCRAGRMIFL